MFFDSFSLKCFVTDLQRKCYILDSIVVAGGNELRFEVHITEAVYLSSLCPNIELLALSSHSNGGHSLFQLDFPNVGKENKWSR